MTNAEDEIRAADVAKGHIGGLHEDQSTGKNVGKLHDG
jgi:hypothetical protein